MMMELSLVALPNIKSLQLCWLHTVKGANSSAEVSLLLPLLDLADLCPYDSFCDNCLNLRSLATDWTAI